MSTPHPLVIAMQSFIDETDAKMTAMKNEHAQEITKMKSEHAQEINSIKERLSSVESDLAKIRVRDLIIAFRIHVSKTYGPLVAAPSGASAAYWTKRKNYDALLDQVLSEVAPASIKQHIASHEEAVGDYRKALMYSATAKQEELDRLTHDLSSLLSHGDRT